MGFDFTVIAPLLPSHWGFSFVFGCGVSFLVSSSVFLSMIVQQLVVILVFSQEGVRACPSTPPSWFLFLLNSFSDSSLLAYRKATEFCILILYPAALLNSFFLNCFFGRESRIFYIQCHVICKQWQFYFFPSNLDAFYFFPCLIAVARTSSTIVNRSGESGHPCLVPEFRGKALIFPTLSMMLDVGFYIWPLLCCDTYTHFAESFYNKWMLNFVSFCFCF